MASQNSPVSPTQSRGKKPSLVLDPPKFDLESYLQNYSGRTRYERLIHIGVCSAFLGVEALKLAIQEAKNGKDIRRYIDAVSHLQMVGPQEPEATRDEKWISNTDKTNTTETHRLEAELKGYKNNLIKESIRLGYEDLGKHYHAVGDLPKSFEAFSRMRQESGSTKHIVDISRHLIDIAAEMRNWIAVSSNVQKITSVMTANEDDKTLQPFICAADGLAHLEMGNYQNATLCFIRTEAGMGSSANHLISPNDIAIYGGLCALATMDRDELQSRLLENSNFRTYLELEPQIRRAISDFVHNRYAHCLQILEGYRTDYILDIYMQKHIDQIYSLVRSKCIVQYFIPFSVVTLDSMNKLFGSQGKSVEKELVTMIQYGMLDARINTVDRVLEAVPSKPRATVQREALEMVDSYEHEARRRIFHMNVAMSDAEVRGNKRGGGQHMGGDDFFDNGGRELRSRIAF